MWFDSRLRHNAFRQGCQVVMSKKRPDQPLKKPNSIDKSQMQDKYTTTPLKHPNALLKDNIHVFFLKE